jgi:mRNA interferase MazF
MMTCEKWDIVLVLFPFTNLRSIKKRPALIISPNRYNNGPDVVILFVTSNIKSFGRTGDYIIQKWEESGLPKPSMTRMKFATIERFIIIKKLGRITSIDQDAIGNELQTVFSLKEK